jgi:hypothetical protein
MSTDDHTHGPDCGHTAIRHDDHIDHLHDGEMHHEHPSGRRHHVLEVGGANPADCTGGHDCDAHDDGHAHGPDCGHEAVPHGDHVDYLVDGHLHHAHGDHCDHHGDVEVVQPA